MMFLTAIKSLFDFSAGSIPESINFNNVEATISAETKSLKARMLEREFLSSIFLEPKLRGR